ncbi:hypothetical protein ACWGAN_35480 [Streptomyces sp. NPDC054945]
MSDPAVDPAHEEPTRLWRQHRPPGPLLPDGPTQSRTFHAAPGGGGRGAEPGGYRVSW